MSSEMEDIKNSRKRTSMQSDEAESVLQMICSHMSNLDAFGTSEKSKCIEGFVSVLMCTATEAEFYLESANWNIGNAVNIFLEGRSDQSQKDLQYVDYTYGQTGNFEVKRARNMGTSSSVNRQMLWGDEDSDPYVNRKVIIAGLEGSEWAAYVNASSGEIYFENILTGARQRCVPPGFADNVNYVNGREDIQQNAYSARPENNMPLSFEDGDDDAKSSCSDNQIEKRIDEV